MDALELIRDLPIEATPGVSADVLGITHDSRRVEPGDLFVALVGERFDGRVFISDAIGRGAVAVLSTGQAPTDFDQLWLQSDRPRDLMGTLAGRLYEHPDLQLQLVGVTGTNGKSTVVALLRSIFEAAGRPCASIGTLGYRFGSLIFSAERTTPEASDLQRMLRSMSDAGAKAAAMEVSSHALSLGRVDGLQYDLAVFTNLTRDHFDFHKDFDGYFEAKSRLFEQIKPGGRAVINIGDPYGRRLAERLSDCLTFGPDGDITVDQVTFDVHGTRGTLSTPQGPFEFETSLLGAFNLENVMAAVAGAVALEIDFDNVRRALGKIRPLAGRLEPVDCGQGFPVLVDYAHTDAALGAALKSVKEFTGRRLILVFGCGGDRDPGKRVLMGRVAGQFADHSIATSDNPRNEDPWSILQSVEEGLRQSGSGSFETIVDRREAIRRAVELADAGCAILVAGKGHEEMQIIGEHELPFSDRDELKAALEERLGARNSE